MVDQQDGGISKSTYLMSKVTKSTGLWNKETRRNMCKNELISK